MPINSRISLTIAACVGVFLLGPAARALDDVKTPAGDAAAARMFKDPRQAMSQFLHEYQSGAAGAGIEALRYAADGGDLLAGWKLGNMYALGDVVQRDDMKAYEYFFRLVRAYDNMEPSPRDRGILSRAFVAVGAYSLNGIPVNRLPRDPDRAQRMFSVAATEFGDTDAQYNLGRMYLQGDGLRRDPRRGAQWLRLAADKNHMEAQALLGQLYFNGDEGVQRQRAMGLMYLTMARDSAGDRKVSAPDTPGAPPRSNQWIVDAYNHAMDSASNTDRQGALMFLRSYLEAKR